MQNESSYLTLELFQRCVPPFQAGLKAKEALEADDGSMPRAERVKLKKLVREGEDAWGEFMQAISWLVDAAVRTEINKPRTFHFDPDADELRMAGMEGAYKMMKNADLDKMNSAVNYLMQWVNTYIARAAYKEEAQFGLSMSKIQTFRKISAIRAKLSGRLGREATDEEVYEFVNNGKAHVRTFMGRSGKGSDTSSSRKADKIPLKTIQEQGEFQAHGASMRYAITDDVQINAMISTPDLESQLPDDSTKAFWEAWFHSMRINPSQWGTIASCLALYDVPADEILKIRSAKRLTTEVQTLIGSETGGLPEFASTWHEKHGPGPWDVFMDMTPHERIELDAEDEDGRPLFRVLKFVKEDADAVPMAPSRTSKSSHEDPSAHSQDHGAGRSATGEGKTATRHGGGSNKSHTSTSNGGNGRSPSPAIEPEGTAPEAT